MTIIYYLSTYASSNSWAACVLVAKNALSTTIIMCMADDFSIIASMILNCHHCLICIWCSKISRWQIKYSENVFKRVQWHDAIYWRMQSNHIFGITHSTGYYQITAFLSIFFKQTMNANKYPSSVLPLNLYNNQFRCRFQRCFFFHLRFFRHSNN